MELIENYTSQKIINEVKSVFEREKIKGRLTPTQKDFVIKNFETFSKKIEPKIKLKVVKEDPDDDELFKVAITANTKYISSGNKHVQAVKSYRGVKVVSPKEFLHELIDDNID